MQVPPVRSLHRDLGYFYVGLIIAFALSGIFLNHRNVWYPTHYVYTSDSIIVALPKDKSLINDSLIRALSVQWGIEKQFKSFRVRGNTLRITYTDFVYDIDIPSGKGERDSHFKIPLLAQSTQLHVETNLAWVWYSDIFGIALLTIAITGMFIQKGKTSFRERGWKFAIVGIIFPLIFLFLIS